MISVVVTATVAAAALSPELKAWAEGPVQYLMTPEEQQQWNSITTDEAARAFIELFWAKRNPDSSKPVNLFHARFEALVKYANDNVGEPATPGWKTDRGKTLILFGPPSRIETTGLRSDEASLMKPPTLGNANRDLRDLPTQRWVYEKDRLPAFAKVRKIEISFVDEFSGGRFEFDRRRAKVNIDALMKDAVKQAIVHPELTPAH